MTKKSVSLSVGRGEKLPVSQGAGLTAKGREKYNAATGSNLKAPAPNPKTPKPLIYDINFNILTLNYLCVFNIK